ncbi:unnamed protein product [Urochloa decumbens]|uniref:Uncharacterized protein n=1 Tax=Urochloa decumbens TaxID=240449 RepID=A0ABC9GTV0_9POAL
MLAGSYAIVVVAALALLAVSAETLHTCDDSGYTANSTFQANLNRLAAALSANASASPEGYSTHAFGTAPDQANGMALCRGDTNASSCATCVAAGFRDAQQACPLRKGATVYQDACTLRLAGSPFLDFLRQDQWIASELFPIVVVAPGSVEADDAWFITAVRKIFTAVINSAAATGTNSTRKYFATGEIGFDPKIYGLAQCVPDLTPAQCRDCLGHAFKQVTQFLNGRPPWNDAFAVWCSLRYSVSPIYDGRAMLQLPAPPATPPVATGMPTSSSGRKRSAAGISAGIACFTVLVLSLSVFSFLRFKRRTKALKNSYSPKKVGRAQFTLFDLPTLQEATEHFSEKNKLGEGGFGTVYKGILFDGQEIAVKKLIGRTGHGLLQLHNELRVLAELQHKNLVMLHGFCSDRNDTLLVYEYIKNGSLDNFLFDDSNRNELKWEQQYNIILGIAKGILYLHEDSSTRIIHRDLKPNNILLDDDMEPKIADFGVARLLGEGHTHTGTSGIVGTLGYIAPEYVMGIISPKIDIFSFGVLVLEIVTRRSNCSYDHSTVNLLTDVWEHWTKGTMSQMLPQSLDGYSRTQALRCTHVGLLCVQPDPDDRPDISSVVSMLTRDSMELHLPAQPAFFFGRESPSTSGSDGQSTYVYGRSGFMLKQGISVNGITITELDPR